MQHRAVLQAQRLIQQLGLRLHVHRLIGWHCRLLPASGAARHELRGV
jgi:hypothetical protein